MKYCPNRAGTVDCSLRKMGVILEFHQFLQQLNSYIVTFSFYFIIDITVSFTINNFSL